MSRNHSAERSLLRILIAIDDLYKETKSSLSLAKCIITPSTTNTRTDKNPVVNLINLDENKSVIKSVIATVLARLHSSGHDFGCQVTYNRLVTGSFPSIVNVTVSNYGNVSTDRTIIQNIFPILISAFLQAVEQLCSQHIYLALISH